ncbi:MAG: PhoH family protein [Phycisphaerales bacterium]
MDLVIKLPSGDQRHTMLGSSERNLKMIREAVGVRIAARDGTIRLSGEQPAVAAARDVLHRLRTAAKTQESGDLSRQQILDMINWAASRQAEGTTAPADDDGSSHGPAWGAELDVYAAGRPVKPQTVNQQAYLDAIRDHDLVFGIGPAGTGKTYLAVAAAVHLLKTDTVRKVILVRPAVEAGERLGFLPGDLQSKVNPYLRPLLDALHDMVDYTTLNRFMASDVIEIVPLAYMRGRTLNRAAIILDEAQNTTRGQMKMFLTRMGHGSKMIVTGDPTQIDLPDPTASGLIDAARVLRNVRGLAFCHLTEADIVRHDLVQRVVEAYRTLDGTPLPFTTSESVSIPIAPAASPVP